MGEGGVLLEETDEVLGMAEACLQGNLLHTQLLVLQLTLAILHQPLRDIFLRTIARFLFQVAIVGDR